MNKFTTVSDVLRDIIPFVQIEDVETIDSILKNISILQKKYNRRTKRNIVSNNSTHGI